MQTIKLAIATLAAVGSLVALSCKNEADSVNPEPKLKDIYNIKHTGLYPEGIDYDTKNNVFVIGSFHKGTVHTLSADGQTFKTLITDPKLVSVLGVYTDETRNRYIVASGDAGASVKSGPNGSTAGNVAYVGIYDATSGAVIKSIDLKTLTPNASALPNDIAVDKDGNIYVTSSFAPNIYKIDINYNASIFTNNTALYTPAAGSFGLNGIVYHPDGYFIAAKTNDNKLFKISLADPTNVTEIGGLNNNIKAPDGLEWTSDGTLIVVENGLAGGKVFSLGSTDNWATANITSQQTIGAKAFPTTAVSVEGSGIYVLESQLGVLLGGDNTKAEFVIKKQILNN